MRSDYEFIKTDTRTLVAALISAYQTITGITVQPASPERLFLAWIADILVQTRSAINYAANQNIPSRARGKNLDALGELFYTQFRPSAKAAMCKVRFRVSEAQQSAILVPKGTRITDVNNTLIWETVSDAYITSGETSVEVLVRCQTPGIMANGYVAGQLNTVVDVFPYYISCENITTTDGGTNEATDEEFFELMKASEDAYSTAGPTGAYIYWAKSVSTEIADVKAIQPNRIVTKTAPVHGGHVFVGGDGLNLATLQVSADRGSAPAKIGSDYTAAYADSLVDVKILPEGSLSAAESVHVQIEAIDAGRIAIFALMQDGTAAGETIKSMILDACTSDKVRPLADYVTVEDPVLVPYDLSVTYYIPSDSTTSAAEIKDRVDRKVKEYTDWQCGKLGRDINPSKLQSLLMSTGIKRVEILSPTFRRLKDGRDHTTPEVAKIGRITVSSGGYEDE